MKEEIDLLLNYVDDLQSYGYHESAYNISNIAKNRLSKMIEGMSQNDTKVKELPKYWAVKRDESNPLWKEFREWFNQKSGGVGSSWNYFGYTDKKNSLRGFTIGDRFDTFGNSPELITLEYWNECVNESSR